MHRWDTLETGFPFLRRTPMADQVVGAGPGRKTLGIQSCVAEYRHPRCTCLSELE